MAERPFSPRHSATAPRRDIPSGYIQGQQGPPQVGKIFQRRSKEPRTKTLRRKRNTPLQALPHHRPPFSISPNRDNARHHIPAEHSLILDAYRRLVRSKRKHSTPEVL